MRRHILAILASIAVAGCAAEPLPSTEASPYCPDPAAPHLVDLSVRAGKGPNCTALCCPHTIDDASQADDSCAWYICDGVTP